MENKNLETATLGAGCFWCVEAVFDDLKGVASVESGYSGGHTENPTYQQVCSETTGHAEVVNVTFDPNEISFKEILQVFFSVHNPTTLNRCRFVLSFGDFLSRRNAETNRRRSHQRSYGGRRLR